MIARSFLAAGVLAILLAGAPGAAADPVAKASTANPYGTAPPPPPRTDADPSPAPPKAEAEPPNLPRLTLTEAVKIALQFNPSIASLQERRSVAQAAEEVAASSGRPFVSLEGALKDGPKSAPAVRLLGLANSSIVNPAGGDIVVGQVIADFGRTLHSVRYRKLLTQSASLDVAAESNYVALLVHRTYNDVLAAQHLRDVAQQDVATRQFIVRQTEAKFDAGLISRVDVDLARAILAEAQVTLIQAENTVHLRFVDLNNAMGINRDQTYQMEDVPTPATEALPPLESDVQTALSHRPEVLGLDAQVRAFREQALAEAAQDKPLLLGVASAGGLAVARTDQTNNQNWAAGLTMTWPIYTGGRVQAQVAAAKHQAEAIRDQREQVAQNVRQEVSQARLTLTALLATEPAVEEQLLRGKDALSLATKRYEAGLTSFLEVQQADLAMLKAQTNEARLRYDIATARAALQYAEGLLGPPTVPGR